MNQKESLHHVIATEQIVMRMYQALDRNDYTGASRCFLRDGSWKRGDISLDGQQAILSSLKQRSATLFTRHYVGNFVVLEHSGKIAKAAFCLTVYRSDKGTPPTLPVAEAVPAMLADVECELACSDGGNWLIKRLEAWITFSA
ncbi:conserved hypothetical protein [Cupriavidus taiwanensis]|uniref:SnoaL-like domain-containing protein n=1 Tax=Cupriavidus taiwanensis TaxID=164546 RepID=A0A375CR83_9BURK|nr:nuclear transport factor 2 family protein [Cupriavidus taiwanensis]SOY77942.1 conserved hypothetical protein [Cupriavidus taiwanensis]